MSSVFQSLNCPLSDRCLYLGLDLSTQSVTGVLLDAKLGAAAPAETVRFDDELPQFGTRSGMHKHDGGMVTSPVQMWLRALDMLFDRLSASGKLQDVAAISVSGQQHGSVYWTSEGLVALRGFCPSGGGGGGDGDGEGEAASFSFASALGPGCFALADSPIWADASTGAQCEALEAALAGGAAELARRTGSRAYPRFTGVQISAVSSRTPAAWAATAAVCLVSSFVASLLLGRLAPERVGPARRQTSPRPSLVPFTHTSTPHPTSALHPSSPHPHLRPASTPPPPTHTALDTSTDCLAARACACRGRAFSV